MADKPKEITIKVDTIEMKEGDVVEIHWVNKVTPQSAEIERLRAEIERLTTQSEARAVIARRERQRADELGRELMEYQEDRAKWEGLAREAVDVLREIEPALSTHHEADLARKMIVRFDEAQNEN